MHENEFISQENAGLCKFYAAGFCRYGKNCNEGSHDSEAILKYEEKWLKCEEGTPFITINHTYNVKDLPKQYIDIIAVLDLEGKDEIIELPVVLLDCHTMTEIARFHRYVTPTAWKNTVTNKKIQSFLSFGCFVGVIYFFFGK